MPEEKIEDRSDEMEHDLHKLEDHIADAEKKLEARKEDAADVVGDGDGEQDRGDDDDPDERVDDEVASPT